MRGRRRDLCKVLRECNGEDLKEKEEEDEDEDEFEEDDDLVQDEFEEDDDLVRDEVSEVEAEDVFKKLLPNSVQPSDKPPFLPKAFAPDSSIYTMLMKGYMKNGHVAETTRMLEVIRRQDDSNSLPDKVTYTWAAFFKKALEIIACMEENEIPPNKTKYNKIYVEMHLRMFTSKHASQATIDRRVERKRAAEAFKFWLGLPKSYYGSEWKLGPRKD